MLAKYAIILFSSFAINFVCTALFRRMARSSKLFLCRQTPCIGGIAIGISFLTVSLVAFLAMRTFSLPAAAILVSSLVMLVFGVLDDRFELSVIAKLAVQIVAAVVLIFLGVRCQIIRIGYVTNIVLTMVWVLGITNALNHLDVIDGLAGGSAVISAASFLLLGLACGNTVATVLSLSFIGALLSFLIFNLPPAKIYMGNAGSHLLGFILAAIALIISYAPMERAVALTSPLLILGLPILDTAFLVFARFGKGRSVFRKSNDHVALRFLKKGYSKVRALRVMLALGVYLALSGIYLTHSSNLMGAIVVMAAACMSFGFMVDMGKVTIDG
jgi:UDP-GlcNAc:undecaprenyl-phosphate GlcNAc-1-phosphate transferase